MGMDKVDVGRYVREEWRRVSGSEAIGTTLGVGLDGPGGEGGWGVGVGRGGEEKLLNTNLQIQTQTVRWRYMSYASTRWYRSINRETRLQIDLFFTHQSRGKML